MEGSPEEETEESTFVLFSCLYVNTDSKPFFGV